MNVADHDVSLLYDDLSAAPTFPARIAVESPDRLLILSYYDGLFEVTPNGIELLYGESAIDVSNCAAEDLVASQDGRLFYLPGCNGSPVLSGKADGSGVGILKHVDDLDEYYFWTFGGIARNPPGGVMVNLVGTRSCSGTVVRRWANHADLLAATRARREHVRRWSMIAPLRGAKRH